MAKQEQFNAGVGQAEEINGINLDRLRGLIDTVSADPKEGIASFTVKTKWTGGTRSSTGVRSWTLAGKPLDRFFSIASDEPTELCGTESAPNPQELLMAAINACMMVGFVAVCSLKGIELTSLEFQSEGELDLRGFLGLDPEVKPGYSEMRQTVRVTGSGTREQYEEVLGIVVATSPNYFNLTKPVGIRQQLIVHAAE